MKIRDRNMTSMETSGFSQPKLTLGHALGHSSAVSEVAAFPALGESEESDLLLLTLHRANSILDRNKDSVFAEHLAISSRGEAERAVLYYGQSYMMKLRLSLESIQELVHQLIIVCKRYKVPPSEAWMDMSKGKFDLDMTDENIEGDVDVPDESNRILPEI